VVAQWATHGRLRNTAARLLDIGYIYPHGQDAVVTPLSELLEVGHFPVDRRFVQLEVARMDVPAVRRLNGHTGRLRNAVGHAGSWSPEARDLEVIARVELVQRSVVEDTRLRQLVTQQCQGEFAPIDRRRLLEVLEQERQAANVVLMGVG